jgi:hypothetical protein
MRRAHDEGGFQAGHGRSEGRGDKTGRRSSKPIQRSTVSTVTSRVCAAIWTPLVPTSSRHARISIQHVQTSSRLAMKLPGIAVTSVL